MAKAKKAAKKKPREIVVVGSKVKDVVRSAGLRSDGELVQAVSEKVHDLLEAAIKRAQGNKRGTVRPYDL
jgi:histone H3/H4